MSWMSFGCALPGWRWRRPNAEGHGSGGVFQRCPLASPRAPDTRPEQRAAHRAASGASAASRAFSPAILAAIAAYLEPLPSTVRVMDPFAGARPRRVL